MNGLAILRSMDGGPERETCLRELRRFLFFHLGSDAKVTVHPTQQGLEVEVEHQRVRPMHLRFEVEEMVSMSGDRTRFEDHLLAFLTRYRRS